MEEKIIEISKITHDEELEKILQKYPLEEGYDIKVVPIDATREKIIIKKVAFNSTEQKEVFTEFLRELGMKREAIIKKVEEVYSKEKDVSQALENEIEEIVNKVKEKALN